MTAATLNVNEIEAAALLINKFNIALPSIGAALSDGVVVSGTDRIQYVNISFSSTASGVLTLKTTVGATTVSETLNNGIAIPAGARYQVTLTCFPGETLNFSYSVTTGYYTLKVGRFVQNG